MAAYVLDGYPPPPELAKALDYRAWGVNLLQMPAGELSTANAAYNTYTQVRAWQTGGVKWTEANPQAWGFVSGVLARRAEAIRDKRWPLDSRRYK